MKVLSLFSGIGAFEKALDYLNIKYELVNYCEIDKYASLSYSLIHNVPETMNLGDITKVDEKLLPNDIDLLTHGSPCQDFSLAGNQRGGDKGSGTRSSLMWDTIRIVKHCNPKIVIWENVKNLLSKKHRHNFDAYLQTMDELNYNSYYKVLNSKNYGIPQNRERVYTISIRKDIDPKTFEFPQPLKLKLKLKDMLEDEVDEKYYLSEKMIKDISFSETKNPNLSLLIKNATKKGFDIAEEGDSINLAYPNSKTRRGRVGKQVAQTLQCNDNIGVVVKDNLWTPTQAQMITEDGNIRRYIGSDVVDEFEEGDCADISFPNGYNKGKRVFKGYAPTINGTTTASSFIVKTKNNIQIPLYKNTKQLRETIEKNNLYEEIPANLDLYNRSVYEESQTITDHIHNSQRLWDGLRIRKLTCCECFRLMGFEDEVINTLQGKVSNTQLYKQAGNSIVVDVLEEIFVNLFNAIPSMVYEKKAS